MHADHSELKLSETALLQRVKIRFQKQRPHISDIQVPYVLDIVQVVKVPLLGVVLVSHLPRHSRSEGFLR